MVKVSKPSVTGGPGDPSRHFAGCRFGRAGATFAAARFGHVQRGPEELRTQPEGSKISRSFAKFGQ